MTKPALPVWLEQLERHLVKLSMFENRHEMVKWADLVAACPPEEEPQQKPMTDNVLEVFKPLPPSEAALLRAYADGDPEDHKP